MEYFDQAAKGYDAEFTDTCVGIAQREQVWKYIERLDLSKAQSVLEINCGTGVDAHAWKKRGFEIIATDISTEMLEVARAKHPDIEFDRLDANAIAEYSGKYDIIFSNFGGLNCLSPSELKDFIANSIAKLNPGGRLILVIMGQRCWWDRWFMILKGKFSERHRRSKPEGLLVNVQGQQERVMYYRPRYLKELAHPAYKTEYLKPVGLFVPPSFLANAFEKRPILFRFLRFLDKSLSFSWLSNQADHYFISLIKNKS